MVRWIALVLVGIVVGSVINAPQQSGASPSRLEFKQEELFTTASNMTADKVALEMLVKSLSDELTSLQSQMRDDSQVFSAQAELLMREIDTLNLKLASYTLKAQEDIEAVVKAIDEPAETPPVEVQSVSDSGYGSTGGPAVVSYGSTGSSAYVSSYTPVSYGSTGSRVSSTPIRNVVSGTARFTAGVASVPVRVVQNTASRVASNYRARWTYPGVIDQHLMSDHGVNPSGMSVAGMEYLHDSIHDGIVSSSVEPSVVLASGPAVIRSRSVVSIPRATVTYPASNVSNCPGGVCPTGPSTTVRRGLFGVSRKW